MSKPQIDDDDDLDDLDDVLDQFTPPPPDSFTKEQESAFRAAWEAMLVEGMDGMSASPSAPAPGPTSASPTASASASGGKEKGKNKESAEGTGTVDPSKQDFQAGIRAAFEKLKLSESGLKSDDAQPTSASTDPLEAFLNQLNAAGLGEGEGADGEENEEEIQNMLEMMMSSLMSKEVLYEPLKELADKFPPYLTTNSATLPQADKYRYEQQLDRIREILKVFEEDGYSDEDGKRKGRVVQLMGEMQSFGTPPTEIMGDLPPGFGVDPDGMPQIPEGCCVS